MKFAQSKFDFSKSLHMAEVQIDSIITKIATKSWEREIITKKMKPMIL